MPDYNIYLHAVGIGAGSNNPTVPWSKKENGDGDSVTTSKSGDFSGVYRGIIRAAGYAQNPDSVVSTATSGALKSLPWVAAAWAVIRAGIKIYETALDFKTIESGDYTEQIRWNDAKQAFHNTLAPVSAVVNSFKTTQQWRVENYRKQGQRELLGDSVINSYTGRGV